MVDRATRCNLYGPTLVRAFVAHNVPPAWALGIARQESDFVPDAEALSGGDERRGGSFGLCAMSLKTAQSHMPNVTVAQLKDPAINAELAAKECAQLIRRFGVTLPDVAAAYNSGKPLSRAPDSTREVYVPNVVKFTKEYTATAQAMVEALHGK